MTHARTMIVTGASSGIGRALALRAARAGFAVLAVARRGELLAELAHASGNASGEIVPLAIDVCATGAPKRIAAAALQRWQRIDVLVNNAGSVAVGPISQQSDAELRRQFALHVTAPLALLREALASLRATHGHVFFVGSGVARVPVGGLGAYPSAKAAIRNAARIARTELRADGVAVTYIDPGAVDTEFMRRAGLAGAPKALASSPEMVARKIMRALGTRPAVLNIEPWQTAFVALGEAFPGLADYAVSRAPHLVGGQPTAPVTVDEPADDAPESVELDAILAPLAHRMDRLKLPRAFVAALLQAGATLDAGDVALRWAGMPNKNERAIVNDVLEALASAGALERTGDDAYRVIRDYR